MIYGIGTDIVLLERIDALFRRYGDRFARRILGPDELLEFERRRSRGAADGIAGTDRAVRYLAKRFAGKEAFSKALGLGLRGPWRAIRHHDQRMAHVPGRWTHQCVESVCDRRYARCDGGRPRSH